MLDMWNVSNSLIMFCYHQCPTMDPGSCGDASEDQSDRPIENTDCEAVLEEPPIKSQTLKVSNTGSLLISCQQL
jgi:hypothetical protein